jgi:thioredoxin 1
MIAPILEDVAVAYGGKLKVVKINIDDNPKTPGEYGIRGIPTLLLFKGGNLEAQKVGAVSKSQLTSFIDSNI